MLGRRGRDYPANQHGNLKFLIDDLFLCEALYISEEKIMFEDTYVRKCLHNGEIADGKHNLPA